MLKKLILILALIFLIPSSIYFSKQMQISIEKNQTKIESLLSNPETIDDVFKCKDIELLSCAYLHLQAPITLSLIPKDSLTEYNGTDNRILTYRKLH